MADGFGRLVLEVSTPDGSLSAASSEQIAWTTIEGYRRAAKTLRWTGPDRVDVVPCIDFLGHDTGVFAVTIEQLPAGLQLRELHQDGLPDAGKKRVHAAAESSDDGADADRRRPPHDHREPTVPLVVPDPDAREIRTIGGGPTNYVPDQYWKTLHALFDQLGAVEWQEWWAPADLPTLETWWSAEKDGRERLFVRRSTNKMIARIERTSEALRTADPVRAARDDLAGLMRAVQRRMGLGTPPTLR